MKKNEMKTYKAPECLVVWKIMASNFCASGYEVKIEEEEEDVLWGN